MLSFCVRDLLVVLPEMLRCFLFDNLAFLSALFFSGIFHLFSPFLHQGLC